MEKLEKLMSTKWVLFVVSAVIAAIAIGQEIYLAGGHIDFNIAMLGVVIPICCGAFCELARITMYKGPYNIVNVAIWAAAGVVIGILAALIW